MPRSFRLGATQLARRSGLPIADAASYAIKHFPDATKHFRDKKPEQRADFPAALLRKIEPESLTAPPMAGQEKGW